MSIQIVNHPKSWFIQWLHDFYESLSNPNHYIQVQIMKPSNGKVNKIFFYVFRVPSKSFSSQPCGELYYYITVLTINTVVFMKTRKFQIRGRKSSRENYGINSWSKNHNNLNQKQAVLLSAAPKRNFWSKTIKWL